MIFSGIQNYVIINKLGNFGDRNISLFKDTIKEKIHFEMDQFLTSLNFEHLGS